jgi:hypothetical protein
MTGAVPVRQHLFGLKTLEQTAPNKGAQDAFAQAGLHLGHGIRIHDGGRVEDDTVTTPLLARHRLKHPIDQRPRSAVFCRVPGRGSGSGQPGGVCRLRHRRDCQIQWFYGGHLNVRDFLGTGVEVIDPWALSSNQDPISQGKLS